MCNPELSIKIIITMLKVTVEVCFAAIKQAFIIWYQLQREVAEAKIEELAEKLDCFIKELLHVNASFVPDTVVAV